MFEDGELCADCNSGSSATGGEKACGFKVSVRCYPDSDDVFGIAIGLRGEGLVMYGGARSDDDITSGPSDDDTQFCGQMVLSVPYKAEEKCSTELKGNEKNSGSTKSSFWPILLKNSRKKKGS